MDVHRRSHISWGFIDYFPKLLKTISIIYNTFTWRFVGRPNLQTLIITETTFVLVCHELCSYELCYTLYMMKCLSLVLNIYIFSKPLILQILILFYLHLIYCIGVFWLSYGNLYVLCEHICLMSLISQYRLFFNSLSLYYKGPNLNW